MTSPVGLLRGWAVPETGPLPVPLTGCIQLHTARPGGHKATDTELTYAPVSQAYGLRHKLQFNV